MRNSFWGTIVLAATLLAAPALAQSAMPGPPSLTNPQDLTTYGGDPTGVMSANSAMSKALAKGDIHVKLGQHFRLDGTSSGITPPSGRKILCDQPSYPPTKATQMSGFNTPTAPGGDWRVFNQWAGELYGCEWTGYHKYASTWNFDHGTNEAAVQNFTTGNFKAYANDFHGWPGFIGVLSFTQSSYPGSAPSNIDVSYNNFTACNVRSVEADFVKNTTITHNNLIDCPAKSEIQDYRQTGQTLLIDNNNITFTTTFGQPDDSSHFNDEGGNVCHDPGGAWPCTGTHKTDYSGTTFSNNTFSSASSIKSWMVVSDSSDPIIKGVYRSNTCNSSGMCTELGGPGNPNSNVWGAGSNQ